MTEHDVRLLNEDEFRHALDTFYATLHRPQVTDEKWSSFASRYDPKRIFGAFVDGELAGTVMSLASALAVPGGSVLPATAVTGVGVRADRTRRGVLTALMRAQLTAARAQGEPVAMLHASETRIYGRYGYGVASRSRKVSMRRADADLHPDVPRGGRVRLVDTDTATKLLPEIYRRVGLVRSGMMERSDTWWQTRAALSEGFAVAVHSADDGVDDGFALYRVRMNDYQFDDGKAVLQAHDIQAADATAAVELWRFLLNVDLVTEVVAVDRPVDEPLEWWLADRRVCQVRGAGDDLWLRLLDVLEALRARSFGTAEPVVLEVRDPFLPENSGNYRITPDTVDRCDRQAQLSLDVDVLAALYLGDVTVSTLLAANRIGVRDSRAIPAAETLFRTNQIPWCGTGF